MPTQSSSSIHLSVYPSYQSCCWPYKDFIAMVVTNSSNINVVYTFSFIQLPSSSLMISSINAFLVLVYEISLGKFHQGNYGWHFWWIVFRSWTKFLLKKQRLEKVREILFQYKVEKYCQTTIFKWKINYFYSKFY